MHKHWISGLLTWPRNKVRNEASTCQEESFSAKSHFRTSFYVPASYTTVLQTFPHVHLPLSSLTEQDALYFL